MYLKLKDTGDLVDVCVIESLFDPACSSIVGRSQSGEEEQPKMEYLKSALIFPSGESLPVCWLDANYNQPD